MPKKLTKEDFINKLEKEIFILVGEFYDISTTTKFKCKKCGSISDLVPSSVLYNHRKKCKKCPSSLKKDTKTFKKEIEEMYGSEYSLMDGEEYKNNKIPLRMIHNSCGTTYLVRPNDFLYGKKCPTCANLIRGKRSHVDDYLNKILKNAYDGSEYEWIDSYNHDNKEKLLIKHISCNSVYKVRPNDFQQGYRCPECSSTSNPKLVKWLKRFLKDKKIGYLTEVKFDGLKYKLDLRCDFLINDLVLEIDGMQHFNLSKSSSWYNKDERDNIRNRDACKNNFFKNNHEYNFLRVPTCITISKLKEILLEYLTNHELSSSTIFDNNLFYSSKSNNIVLNETTYYTNINKNYFTDL